MSAWERLRWGCSSAQKLYADYMGMLGYLTDPQFAMGNLLICYFQGKKPYSPEYGDPFVFPASWMVLFLLCSFLTLDYPFHNLNGHGVQVVTRMRSRRVWWASKCIWVAVATLYPDEEGDTVGLNIIEF